MFLIAILLVTYIFKVSNGKQVYRLVGQALGVHKGDGEKSVAFACTSEQLLLRATSSWFLKMFFNQIQPHMTPYLHHTVSLLWGLGYRYHPSRPGLLEILNLGGRKEPTFICGRLTSMYPGAGGSGMCVYHSTHEDVVLYTIEHIYSHTHIYIIHIYSIC